MTEYAHNHPPELAQLGNDIPANSIPANVTWHRTNENHKHETWRCDPEVCGSRPTQRPTAEYACCHQLVGGMWATQTTEPPSQTSTPDTQARSPEDLVGHLRDAVDRAKARRQADSEPTPHATPTPGCHCGAPRRHHIDEDCPAYTPEQ